jgi:hypothetical protein
MKIKITIVTALVSLCSLMYGQAAPTAVASMSSSGIGPSLSLPGIDGTLHYALSASQMAQTGWYSIGTSYTTSFSGDIAYTSQSEFHPFSLLYSGGILISTLYQNPVQTFQNANISQGLMVRNWIFNVSDSVSYLPQTPTTGYSGIPGVGDLGSTSGPSQGPAGGVLTDNGKRVGNSLDGTIERRLGGATSVSGSADWSILRFVDGSDGYQGLDTNSVTGTVALNRRFNARNSGSVDATYSTFSYGTGGNSIPVGVSGLSFQARGINFQYQRIMSRALSFNASVGPQWIDSSNSLLIPHRLTTAAAVGLIYSRRVTTAEITYNRGANGGSGVQQGSVADNVTGSVSREYGRNWNAALNLSYAHSVGIQNPAAIQIYGVGGTYNTVYGGVQVSRRIGQHASGYFSYTVQDQSASDSGTAINAFSGTAQTFAIGITYTPRSTRLGQF